MSEVRIGTSGWVYRPWKGDFYPPDLPASRWFEHYASQFDTTELNGSFYRLPSERAVAAWAEKAPGGFLFAWKASRFITHNKKLKGVEDSLALVFGRMAPLGPHFGPVLFQLPPSLRRDDERLGAFLALLPRDRRCTIEFRHPSWYAPEVFSLLRGHGVALCISDHAAAPAPWERTAPFVYVRGHGPSGRYHGSYDDAALARWADAVRDWGCDAYGYLDNDIKGAAPRDAKRLIEALRRRNVRSDGEVGKSLRPRR